ncbi:MAG: VOC family protein [Candidatus Poribacteria bacterium]|jgi:catechol 2,3-dioxygenase-like lactoylglutathione lyase family enzyme|nr:VOC family protein [Candidatus Poribacteria bacterium]
MSNTKLLHIGIRATNLQKSIRFWRDALDLDVSQQAEKCFDLTDGYHNFRIFQHNGPERPDHVSGMLDYLHIGVYVPDLKVAAQRCLDMGFQIFSDGLGGEEVLDPQNLNDSAFKVADPDGITVDITCSDRQWPDGDI